MSLSAKLLGNAVAGTDYIVAIVDNPVTSKNFNAVSYSAGGSAPTLGSSTFSAGVPSGMTGFPQLSTLSQVTATDPVSSDVYTGQFKVVLTPNSADTVTASSPQTFYFSPNAMAITASTSTG